MKEIKEICTMNKYGVRIYPLDSKVILVKQTVKKEGGAKNNRE